MQHITNARVALLGNPSDIYNGRVIASTITDFSVFGTLNRSSKTQIFLNNIYQPSSFNIISCSINFLAKQGINVPPFIYKISSSIPKQAGLGGSSAIIVNFLKNLSNLDINLDLTTIAHYATLIEKEEMRITSGPQDRFIITFGGSKFMDFTKTNYKEYIIEDIDISNFPLWVAVREKTIGSGDFHLYPYKVYKNDFSLQELMFKIKECALIGKKALNDNDIILFGKLMNKNQQLSQVYGTYGNPSPEVIYQRRIDQELLIQCYKQNLLGAKLTGSSGSLVILSEEKPDFLLDYKINPNENPQISKIYRVEPGRTFS